MEIKTFSIHINKYKELTNTDSTFEGSFYFDLECGIDYIGLDKENETNFLFNIINMQKFFLAKIKYGF